LLALLIGSAVVGVVTWIAVGTRAARLEAVTKPVTLLLLIGWFAGQLIDRGLYPGIAVLIALGASVLGDVLLLRPQRRLLAGMGAFLFAQIAYAFALNAEGPVLSWASLGIGVGVIAVAVGGFAFLSRRARWHKRRWLKGATVVYTAALALMLWSAAAVVLRPDWPPLARGLILGGAIAFCLSDTLLGWIEFVRPSRRGLLAVMVSYHLAQWALAIGFCMSWYQ
jgi:uncharacterized membrane protein YhhN